MLEYCTIIHVERWRAPSPKRLLDIQRLDGEIRPEGCLTILLVKKCQRFLLALLGRRTLAVLQPTIWSLVSSMVAAFCEQRLRIIVCLDNMLTMVQSRQLLAVQADLVKTIPKSQSHWKITRNQIWLLPRKWNSLDIQSWCLCFRDFATFPERIRKSLWKAKWLWGDRHLPQGDSSCQSNWIQRCKRHMRLTCLFGHRGEGIIVISVHSSPFSSSFNSSE